ncbi:nitrile hydratase subunit beta [Hydrogenophaga sp. BPS33]|uniref:nitrile hydratase subunit beta n=1 Tax=Hydrogenophaga sp. BPS33 TaxID=2651974 RepID=UPI00132009ED|nr:nitrile hydratase subunit beta [Hydrogenophaga sp. BPS33]QHE84708.1 nitrile hydratase subunit beta [Hydrogenophaga sp. BPS33]
MDGIHDMGGRQGFGVVRFRPGNPRFEERWQALSYGLMLFGATRPGGYSMDQLRHAIERMEPRHYMGATYSERILTGTATLLVEAGVVSHEELEERAGGAFPLAGETAAGRLARDKQWTPLEHGQQVRVKNLFVDGHIRLPGYVRGRTGIVVGEDAPYPFPDAAGHGLPAREEPTYFVQFDARELWADSDPNASVTLSLWRSYFEPINP